MLTDVAPGDRPPWGAERTGRVTVRLDGAALCILTSHTGALESVMGMLVPACSVTEPGAAAQWTLEIEEHDTALHEDGDPFQGRLVLELPYGGRRLAVMGTGDGVMRLAAAYRRDAPPAVMEVDARRRVTRLLVAPGDVVGLRWGDYLARVFFASRLLASGWRMLHASAVAVDGRALVFLAGRHGGKSTLAHRAVRDLGARFLADDLVLVGPDGTVAGWPTRVAVPAQLAGDAGGRREHTVVAGVARDRVLFTPAQHRTALGVEYSPPVPLGAVVIVAGGREGGTTVRAETADAEILDRAVTRAADVPQQLLYVSDPLGLMGGPRLADQAAGAAPAKGLLAGARTAILRTAAERLPQAPVWQALEGILSEQGRHR